MIILGILLFLAISAAGYFLGTLAQKQIKIKNEALRGLSHYWIYGFILAIIGLSFLKGFWQVFFIALGIGLFVSDIKNFSKIEVPTPEIPEIKINPGEELKKMFLPNESAKNKVKTKVKKQSKKTASTGKKKVSKKIKSKK